MTDKSIRTVMLNVWLFHTKCLWISGGARNFQLWIVHSPHWRRSRLQL